MAKRKMFEKLIARFKPPRPAKLTEAITNIIYRHFYDLEKRSDQAVVIAKLFETHQMSIYHHLLRTCRPEQTDSRKTIDPETRGLGTKIHNKFREFGFNKKDIPGEFYRLMIPIKQNLISNRETDESEPARPGRRAAKKA